MRDALKAVVRAMATIVVAPALLSYCVKRLAIGPDRALEGSTQALAWLPGVPGTYLRGAFLAQVLASFDRTASVHYGTILSQAGARIDANVYVGPGCHLGLVHLQRDVLIASGVQIPSGPDTHGTERVDIPIREGEIFLLPARVPHSPQRFENTVGLVIERKRRPDEQDGFLWYCEHCQYPLYAEYLHVSDIEKQLPPIFDRFYQNPKHRTCQACGAVQHRS